MLLLRTFSIGLLLSMVAGAQPPVNVLQRVLMIESEHGRGTAFSIDNDGREYWITAKHLLTGAPGRPYGTIAEETVELRLLDPDAKGLVFQPHRFSILEPSTDVDIVVLVPSAPILSDVPASPPVGSFGMEIGSDCRFLGFPHSGGWRGVLAGTSLWMPFVKGCMVSGTHSETGLWVLDGLSNAGFSGGPVIVGTGDNVSVAAVVSSYVPEPADIIRGESKLEVLPPTITVILNSGFILAYDIQYAVDLINENPVGPLRENE